MADNRKVAKNCMLGLTGVVHVEHADCTPDQQQQDDDGEHDSLPFLQRN
jgi:hypothetical protein